MMLCTSARVVLNDGKPNDHLIPFELRDIPIMRGAMPRPVVRVAASASRGLCATVINGVGGVTATPRVPRRG